MKPTIRTLALALALAMTAGVFGNANADEAAAPPNQSTPKNPVKLVDVAQAEKLIAAKTVVILDVRTPSEFAAGHLAGATNLDIHSRDFQSRLEHLDKRQSYLVHCAVGMRSARAAALMSGLDFKSVYDLKGGLDAWHKAGKPVVK
jgi:rhodanese-related sulfurtransferase